MISEVEDSLSLLAFYPKIIFLKLFHTEILNLW